MLELLLIVDMLISINKAFYNAQGVLVYRNRDIRVKYFSESFIIDLIAAMPFQILVQVRSFPKCISACAVCTTTPGPNVLEPVASLTLQRHTLCVGIEHIT